jgi:biopolymer transport protein ExbD
MSARGSRPVADINVTPMIDVLLVLLIVFMVTVPVAQRNLHASIPAPPQPTTTTTTPPSPLPVLQVHAADFELNKDRHATAESLARGLEEVLSSRRDKTVVVQSDDDVDYGRVVAAMDLAKGAGADRIGIVSTAAPVNSPSPR